jgi:hypothetical protein
MINIKSAKFILPWQINRQSTSYLILVILNHYHYDYSSFVVVRGSLNLTLIHISLIQNTLYHPKMGSNKGTSSYAMLTD